MSGDGSGSGIKVRKNKDRELFRCCVDGDVRKLDELVRKNKKGLAVRTLDSGDSLLHVAARHVRTSMVRRLLELRPKMVWETNADWNTPLNIACQQEHKRVSSKLVLLLVRAQARVRRLSDKKREKALQMALTEAGEERRRILRHGLPEVTEHAEIRTLQRAFLFVVKIGDEETTSAFKTQSLHRLKDKRGYTALHQVTKNDYYLDIATDVVSLDEDMISMPDNKGRTPIHSAAIAGNASFLTKFIGAYPQSAKQLTDEGESIIHLCAKHNQVGAFQYIVQHLDDIQDLINSLDKTGMTPLHIACEKSFYELVKSILSCTEVNVNSLTSTRRTALDLVAEINATPQTDQISTVLLEAGAKRSAELDQMHDIPPTSAPLDSYNIDILESRGFAKTTDGYEGSSAMRELRSERSSVDASETAEELSQAKDRAFYATTTRRWRKNSLSRRQHHKEIHYEGLRNSRNTIAIIAVLIATVSFAAGIAPPGGFHQDGSLAGKVVLGRTFSFQLFMVTNGLALFTSLGIVITLVSIVPFRRKALLQLLVVTHRVMWVSAAFMAAAYMAAAWLVMEEGWKTRWAPLALTIIGTVSMVSLFIGLRILLVRQEKERAKRQHAKEAKVQTLKWDKTRSARKGDRHGEAKPKVETESEASTFNISDLYNSQSSGYMTF